MDGETSLLSTWKIRPGGERKGGSERVARHKEYFKAKLKSKLTQR